MLKIINVEIIDLSKASKNWAFGHNRNWWFVARRLLPLN